MAEVEKKRPSMPKYSKDLLIHRNIEGHLAKQGKYTKATRVKDAADRMEAAEMETTQATFDAELSLKVFFDPGHNCLKIRIWVQRLQSRGFFVVRTRYGARQSSVSRMGYSELSPCCSLSLHRRAS